MASPNERVRNYPSGEKARRPSSSKQIAERFNALRRAFQSGLFVNPVRAARLLLRAKWENLRHRRGKHPLP